MLLPYANTPAVSTPALPSDCTGALVADIMWDGAYLACRTTAGAFLTGILCVLASTPPTEQINISTTSKYAIRAICYRAGISYTEGWNCANGDLLEHIAGFIRLRRVQVGFFWVNKPDTNPAHLGAKALALGAVALNV